MVELVEEQAKAIVHMAAGKPGILSNDDGQVQVSGKVDDCIVEVVRRVTDWKMIGDMAGWTMPKDIFVAVAPKTVIVADMPSSEVSSAMMRTTASFAEAVGRTARPRDNIPPMILAELADLGSADDWVQEVAASHMSMIPDEV